MLTQSCKQTQRFGASCVNQKFIVRKSFVIPGYKLLQHVERLILFSLEISTVTWTLNLLARSCQNEEVLADCHNSDNKNPYMNYLSLSCLK